MIENKIKQKFKKAIEQNAIEIVRLLLSISRVDPSENNNYDIRFASQNGYLEVVRLLLSDSRVDPSAFHNFAIRLASQNGHLEVVCLLLSDPRVDPSAYDNYAICLASQNGHLEVVRLLLSDFCVDFNAIHNQEMKHLLLKEERNKLRNELFLRYIFIEKASPQILIEGKLKSKIPKALLKKIVYKTLYQELFSTISRKIPLIKLLALADLLQINNLRSSINLKNDEDLCEYVLIMRMS